MLTKTVLALIVGAMSVAASYHYPQQPMGCQCQGPCGHQGAGMYGGSGGMYGGGMNGMYGGGMNGMYGGMNSMGGGMYGGGMYGGGMNGGGMNGMAPAPYMNGYRIKPKTKLGWDHRTGGLRLKTKYKVKPMNGYPPVYAPGGFGQAPGFVQNHPLSQYGGSSMGPTFGGGPSYQYGQSMGYGQQPYYSGPGAYNQYGSQQRNCQW